MFADTTPDIEITQSLTSARDSTVIGLAETVNVAYNLLPEDVRDRATTQHAFQQINQLIQQLNHQLEETENKQVSRLVSMNIDHYVRRGTWVLYGLGLLAALVPFLAGFVLLVVALALLGAVVMSARYAREYQRASAAANDTRQQIDAYLQQVDPRLSLAVTRPYRSAARFPALSGHRRWQLIQVVLLTLGGFALIMLILPPDFTSFDGELLPLLFSRAVFFLAGYTLVVLLAGYLRLSAERIKLQLFTEDHLFHLRFGTAAESYVQIVDPASLIEDVDPADMLPHPLFGHPATTTTSQSPAEAAVPDS